jgi:hypothetical protein
VNVGWKAVLVGAVLGIVIFGVARAAFVDWPMPPHYHANWLVFVNGERVDFSDARFMEDVAACAPAEHILPAGRVHMHDGVDHVVHVHHHGVAWGHFLQNIGVSATADHLILPDGRRLFDGEHGTLKYVVNGFAVEDVTTRVIRSGDRLLISFGPEDADHVMREQFAQVPADAEQYNRLPDPAACAGVHELTLGQRLRLAFF